MYLRIRSITSGCSGKEPARRPDTRQRRKSNLVWGLIFPARTRKKINASRTDQQYCKTAKSLFRKLVTCINLQDLSVLFRHLHSNWTQRQKVIGFTSTTLHDWLKKQTRATFSSNQLHFHSLCVSYMWFLRVLISSLRCLCSLWLARMIYSALIQRHSIENLSMYLFLLFCSYKADADRSIQDDLLLLSGGYVLIIVYVSIVLGNFTRMNIKACKQYISIFF